MICKIFYNGKEQELKSSILIEESNVIDKIIIDLIVYKEITNMSYIFNNCSSLLSLTDISKWNINNVTEMSYMFSDCSSLSSLPDISKWNTIFVTKIVLQTYGIYLPQNSFLILINLLHLLFYNF